MSNINSQDYSMYEVKINFDEASEAWLKNKVKLGNGVYKYRCLSKTKKGTQCNKTPLKNSDYCHIHKINHL